MQKKKGRPRAFDADDVLGKAAALFARKGFAATSLDELSQATGLVRPSLYNAFGDKLSLYRHTLAYHLRKTHEILRDTLGGPADVRSALKHMFDAMADYFGKGGGSLALSTAPAEALDHPEIAEDLRTLMLSVGQLLQTRCEQAAMAGQLRAGITPRMAAEITQAVLHSMALRSRAGAAAAELWELGRAGVAAVAPAAGEA